MALADATSVGLGWKGGWAPRARWGLQSLAGGTTGHRGLKVCASASGEGIWQDGKRFVTFGTVSVVPREASLGRM